MGIAVRRSSNINSILFLFEVLFFVFFRNNITLNYPPALPPTPKSPPLRSNQYLEIYYARCLCTYSTYVCVHS